MTQYPAVRGMFCEPSKDVVTVPSVSVPPSPQTKENSTSAKISKVYKPIQPEQKTEPIKIKPEPPKSEPPKSEPPKSEPPKSEPPKPEPSKPEPPKSEPPKSEPPKSEPSKPEPPKSELPKPEPSKLEPSKPEPPKSEPSKPEPPKSEPLKPEFSKQSREAAFLPIVPSPLEKEYWDAKDRKINQFTMFAPRQDFPVLQNGGTVGVMQPSQPSPVYAHAYQPPSIPKETLPDSKRSSLVSEPSADSSSEIPLQKSVQVWNTIDSAMERPLMYGSP